MKPVSTAGALVRTFHADTMLVPIDDLLDEDRCYRLRHEVLHPKGLRCPAGHALPVDQAPHDRHRAPLVDDRCRECGKVFDAFTGTVLQGVRYRCSKLVPILRAFAQGVPTLPLAEWARDDDGDGIREVHCNTMEGFWTGRRNFLRPFRGVSKWFLGQYVAFFAALHNYAALPLAFLGRLLRPSP